MERVEQIENDFEYFESIRGHKNCLIKDMHTEKIESRAKLCIGNVNKLWINIMEDMLLLEV